MTSPAPSEPLTGHQLYHAAPLTPARAAAVVAIAIVTLYAVQLVLLGLGTPALAASAVGDVVVLAGLLGYARRRGVPMRDLGLRGARLRFVVAAILLGLSMWYLTALLVALLDMPGDTTKLQQLVEQTALAPTLVALTVFPAVAEEVLFRGVLLRSLAPRLRAPAAIVISALVFGLYHLFPPQMVSTFVLGLVLCVLTVRSASLVPAMIVHALNNTIAVLLARDEIPGASAWLTAHGELALGGAIVFVASGLVLAARGVAPSATV